MNAKMMISVWPKFYYTTEYYKEFDREGWMYRQAVKDSIRDWVGKGYIGSFYDAYSAGARKLFWKQINEKLYSLGIDSWWMDASEPDIRSCSDIDYRKKLCGPTALGSSTQYFNAYALMNADAIYNGQRGVDNNKRVFLLTRSGYAGLQRYSTATWSGDIGTRWEDMKSQISAGLNFAVSGIPYWTMDIGGFSVEKRYEKGQFEFDKTGRENADYKEWRELNTRWYQFGAFCPLFRSHGVRAEINWNDWGYAGWTNDSVTAFPALTCLAATWNPDMSAAYGKAIGEEARYRGKDVLLGPGVNIYRTPLNGRNFEYMTKVQDYTCMVICMWLMNL